MLYASGQLDRWRGMTDKQVQGGLSEGTWPLYGRCLGRAKPCAAAGRRQGLLPILTPLAAPRTHPRPRLLPPALPQTTPTHDP